MPGVSNVRILHLRTSKAQKQGDCFLDNIYRLINIHQQVPLATTTAARAPTAKLKLVKLLECDQQILMYFSLLCTFRFLSQSFIN